MTPLRPAMNPLYAFPGQDVTIIGKVVGLYRALV